MTHSLHSRRRFIQCLGLATLALPGIAIGSSIPVAGEGTFSQEQANSLHSQNGKPLGIALIGLGGYSTGQLAPALQETRKCRLAGIVTGSPDKAERWKKKYNIPDKNIYNYKSFDSIKDNPDIDIVYVVLPNSMHAEYTIRAAQAGKHVICEKPMAVSVKECEDMIEACRKANRLLSIGYRLHFEPNNLTMVKLAKEKTYGAVKKIIAKDGMNIEPGVWRLDKKMAGGGPLMDVGIYCVQGAIYTAGQKPIAVTAQEGKKTDPEKFKTVEQSLTWQMEFPDGITAACETSYAKEMNLLRAEAEKGWFELEPAYAYKGIKGKTINSTIDSVNISQQALQMDDFANCVMTDQKSRVPGEMGLRDVKILMAIYEAARTGKRIPLTV